MIINNSSKISIDVVLELVKKNVKQSTEKVKMLSLEFQVCHFRQARAIQIWNRYAAKRFGFKNPYEYLMKFVPGLRNAIFSPPPDIVIMIIAATDSVVTASTVFDICLRLTGGIASRKNHK